MVDIRKIIIIFVIAVLFAVFVFTAIEAVYPQPQYDDFCPTNAYSRPYPDAKTAESCPTSVSAPTQEVDACSARKGYIEYIYDADGCATDFRCNTCQAAFNDANDVHNLYIFYISAVLALIAIFVGLYLPADANSLNEWIGTGLMLGGTFALFYGTVRSFGALDRIVRPIVMLCELLLIIFIAYKKIGNLRQDKKK
ncbi:MAG: hypothetical protein ABIH41_07065 [Nanoarchaeota archaeon]